MTVYNSVLQPPPIRLIAWVGYADTAANFVIVDHTGMVLLPYPGRCSCTMCWWIPR